MIAFGETVPGLNAQEIGESPAAAGDRSEIPSTPKPPPVEVFRDYVPVGSYVNRPNVAASEGGMAHTLLSTFPLTEKGSEVITLSVPSAQAAKARYLLATAIVEKGFRIKLLEISPTDGRLVTVTPKSAIRAYLKHGVRAVIIDETSPAPNGRQSIHYRLYDDATWDCDDNSSEAVLMRGTARICSFSARGRGFYFSWSPDSRFAIIPSVRPERDMTVYYLDSAKRRSKVRELNLDAVENRVEALLPRHHYVPTTGRSQIDVDHIEWQSASRCRLHYYYESLEKSGNAILALDLAARKPRFRIVSLAPTAG